MNRALISMIGHGVLGISALGAAAIGFLVYSPTGATAAGKPDGEWRLLDPVSYENLTVFPVVSCSGYDSRSHLAPLRSSSKLNLGGAAAAGGASPAPAIFFVSLGLETFLGTGKVWTFGFCGGCQQSQAIS